MSYCCCSITNRCAPLTMLIANVIVINNMTSCGGTNPLDITSSTSLLSINGNSNGAFTMVLQPLADEAATTIRTAKFCIKSPNVAASYEVTLQYNVISM